MSFKKARESAGFTLAEAAEKIGVSFQAISLWETGKSMPSSARLGKIAKAYNCTIDELLKED